MTRAVTSPRSVGQLRRALLSDPEAIVVGGAAGLMASARNPTSGPMNVDLSALGLGWAGEDRVGAMATLATVERAAHGRRALTQALAATATPALRRMITIGGMLGGRSHPADIAVALAAHDARVRVLHVARGLIAWHSVLDIWRFDGRFVILEVDLGTVGDGRFIRVPGRPHRGPALVSVAARPVGDGSARVCVGAAVPAPTLVDPAALPREGQLICDHLASGGHRHQIMCTLVSRLQHELGLTR
jgi:CO/xanthine dehydrogenase FAD-binding subunit